LSAAAIFLAGYLVAVLSFREEGWVDVRSGARRVTCTLYPFSLATDQSDDAFRVLFGRGPDPEADWSRVSCQHFLRAMDPQESTYGQIVGMAEYEPVAMLAAACAAERRGLGRQFYSALAGGTNEFWRYYEDAHRRRLQPAGGGRKG
jgi:hypothetical protein